jgi:polygalacturonase
MSLKHLVVGITLVAGMYCTAPAQSSPRDGDNLQSHLTNLPFPMPEVRVPIFPARQVSIRDHGAVADGRTLNTEAFAAAIQTCVAAGGGNIIVPPGIWLTGPIRLESNINLHLERGAVILFSRRIEDYPIIAGLDGKSKRWQIAYPISGYKLENVAITGAGIIDGSGEAWRPVKKEKLNDREWKELLASGGATTPDGKIWWPSTEAAGAEEYLKSLNKKGDLSAEDVAHVREFMRPDMIRFVQCTGVLLDGPTFRNSPKFHVHPAQCENMIIRNIHIQTHWWAQNGDGLDLNACRNVLVYNSVFDVGDDALCMKPGNVAKSQRAGPACENIVIDDCVVYHGHGGFVIGSESYGGARNIAVRNCSFIGTDVGLRFKSLRGRGGLVEQIFIDGITMSAIKNEAILFDMYYGDDATATSPARGDAERPDSRTPHFRDFTIKNIVCLGADRAIWVRGLPEQAIQNLHFENLSLTAKRGVSLTEAEGISMKTIGVFTTEGPTIHIHESSQVTFSALRYSAGVPVFLKVEGPRSRQISLENIDVKAAARGIDLGAGVAVDAVVTR